MERAHRLYFFIILVLMQIATVFEMGLSLSFGPVIVDRLSLDAANLGYTALGFAAAGLLSPFLGRMAHHSGLKATFFLMGIIFSLGALTVALTVSPLVYVLGRMMIGIGYFGLLGMIPSVIVQFTRPERIGRMSGIFKLFFALSIFVAPMAGVWLLKGIGFGGIYLLLAAVSLIASLLILTVRGLPRERASENRESRSPLPFEKILPFLLSSLAISVPISLVSTYLGIHLSAGGMGQEEIGLVYSVMGFGSITAGVYSIFLSDRVGKFLSARAALILIIIALTALLPSRGFFLYLTPFLFYLGFDTYTAMFFPTVGLCFPAESHRALTLMTAGQSMGMVAATLLAPMIYGIGFYANVAVAVLCAVICLVTYTLGYVRSR